MSIDLLVAVAASFWVLFVFSISGWIVSFMPVSQENIVSKEVQVITQPESLETRNMVYTNRVAAALTNPTGDEEMRNIYFGIVMGLSAMLPTCLHIFYALFSLRFFLHSKKYSRRKTAPFQLLNYTSGKWAINNPWIYFHPELSLSKHLSLYLAQTYLIT